RTATKRSHEEQRSGQGLLWGADVPFAPDEIMEFLEAQRVAAENTLLALVPVVPASTTYKKVWPRVLEKHVVSRPDVNKLAAELRKSGRLNFPGWEIGKRVPQDAYRVSRPAL
ncbi:MAG: hypothetical protein P4L64_05465, partial [Caulobacteraceae bacterium]|nr:hypothetical protein [Caulobacteraceae bacterium]